MLTIPDPLPAEGYRKLSPREMLQRQRALTCIRSKDIAQCQGQVFATLFFDGTGNNMDWREPGTEVTQEVLGKHSNVARLFNARLDEPENGFFSYYIPGVGTPFDKIGDEDGSPMFGGGAGYMGADRINWGITRIFNAVHDYVIGGDLINDAVAKGIVNNMSSAIGALGFENGYRRMVLRRWEEKLAAVLATSQRKVTQINVAVFGFSRGATEARAFANWLSQLVQQDDGGHALAGVPLRLYFMGLFDTVASVGASDTIKGIDGHMAWADDNLHIPATVEQCVHYIALHEQRASFPLEMAANVRQVAYPGMHSDVGGGYLSTEQGKLSPLSQIPLNDMHREAFKAGVPLLSRDEIDDAPKLRKDFAIPPALITAYNAFWQAAGTDGATGTADAYELIRRHTRQYLQWRGGLTERWQALPTRGFYQRANTKDQAELALAQKDLETQRAGLRLRLRSHEERPVMVPLGKPLPTGLLPVDATSCELLDALDDHASLPAAVRDFFDDYVHDSRAGFVVWGHMEPHAWTGGYLRYRAMFENARHAARETAQAAPVPSDGNLSHAQAQVA